MPCAATPKVRGKCFGAFQALSITREATVLWLVCVTAALLAVTMRTSSFELLSDLDAVLNIPIQ